MITFVPHADLPRVLSQAERDLEEWYKERGEQSQTQWRGWAGDRIEEMMREREATLKCLHAPQRALRLAALSLIADYWPPNKRFAGDVLRLAFEDDDSTVRGAALQALLSLKCYVNDPSGFLGTVLNTFFPRPANDVGAAILRETRESEVRVNKLVRKMWENAAGPHLVRMLESRASAESFLAHPEPDVRCGALMVLADHWKPNAAFADSCERLASEDPEPKVRALAMACLAGCYMHTDDRRIGAFAARFVYDESSPVDLRVAAYRALFTIRGMPTEELAKAGSLEFRFPEEVDWAFVDSFLRHG